MKRLGPLLVGVLLATDLMLPSATAHVADRQVAAPPATHAAARTTATTAAVAATRPSLPDPKVAAFADEVPAETTQVVRTISTHRWCRARYCTVTQAWQKVDGTWRLLRQFRSTIGPNGWGKTKEGDNRSPVGVFRIVVTFSSGKRPGPMPWRQRKPTSNVSDTPGRTYNTWIEVPGLHSGNRPSMRWGWWIDYNHPRLTPGRGPAPVPGKGSGIFYHTSKPGHRSAPTEGCTQVGNPRSMRWLTQWLRPKAQPRVVQDL
jgi:L,D-peptidoglycan transpeptidase YkuD (ErfK/YbiS/YcfS/YnhG family)